MRRIRDQSRRDCLVGAVAVLGLAWAFNPTVVLAQPSVAEVYRAAEKQKDAIKSLHVAYEVSFEVFFQLPSDAKDGITLEATPYKIEFSIMGKKRNMMRTMFDEVIQSYPDDVAKTVIFDGTASLTRVGVSGALIHPNKARDCEHGDYYVSEVANIPLTDAQRATADNGWYFPHPLSNRPRAQAQYKVLADSEVVDGHECHVVHAPQYDKVWVDRELNYWYRKRERYYFRDGKELLRLRDRLRDFVHLNDNVWLPKTWIREVCADLTNPRELWGKPYGRITLKVSTISVNDLSDSDFQLSLPAGSYVSDQRTRNVYRLQGSTQNVLDTLEVEGQRLLFDPSPTGLDRQGKPTRWPVLLVVNGVLFSVVIAVLITRWFKRRRNAAGDG